MARALALLLALSTVAAAQEAESGPERMSVVELFTSEGCSSCPSADDWQRESFPRDHAAAIAFHVDYWDEIGWPDPFSSARYTARQRAMAARGSGRVYTPEVAVNGREADRGALDRALAQAQRPPVVRIHVRATRSGDRVRLEAAATGLTASMALRAVVVESGLVVQVPRGENAGRTLRHDHVARALIEGRRGSKLDETLALGAGWNRARLGVVVFAEDLSSGSIEQAVQLAHID